MVRVDDTAVQLALSVMLRRSDGMSDEITTITADNIASRAKRDVPIGPSAGGHARASVSAKGSTITGGGSKYPYYPWLEFGGRVGINNSVSRTRVRGGRYIYPALVKEKPLIEGRMERGLVRLARSSGLDAR